MQVPAIYNPPNLKIGDSYPRPLPGEAAPDMVFVFTDPVTGDPLPFPDGTTALAQIRDAQGNLIYSWNSTNSTSVVDGNVVTFKNAAGASTAPFKPGVRTFETQTTSGGIVTTWTTGEIVLEADLAK